MNMSAFLTTYGLVIGLFLFTMPIGPISFTFGFVFVRGQVHRIIDKLFSRIPNIWLAQAEYSPNSYYVGEYASRP